MSHQPILSLTPTSGATNPAIEALRAALNNLHRDDFDDMTIEALERLESDLHAWGNLAMVAGIRKRAAIRDEASE